MSIYLVYYVWLWKLKLNSWAHVLWLHFYLSNWSLCLLIKPQKFSRKTETEIDTWRAGFFFLNSSWAQDCSRFHICNSCVCIISSLWTAHFWNAWNLPSIFPLIPCAWVRCSVCFFALAEKLNDFQLPESVVWNSFRMFDCLYRGFSWRIQFKSLFNRLVVFSLNPFHSIYWYLRCICQHTKKLTAMRKIAAAVHITWIGKMHRLFRFYWKCYWNIYW